MSKFLFYLPSIIFNVAETLIIFLIGRLLKLSTEEIILIMVLFAMIRMSFGKAMHYKNPYKCLVWSALVFLSLFVVAKAGIIISIIMSIFCAYILTSRANINDIFMWKGKESKYSDIEEYIKYNEMNVTLLEFEKVLKERDNLLYLLYKYRFKENLTFSEISEKLDLDTPRIAEKLDKIAFSIRIFCGI